MKPLPLVPLGELAVFVRGVTFKPEDVSSDGVRVMRTKNVQTVLDQSDVIRIPPHLVKRGEQYLRAGDILISSANSWNLVGRCCWIPKLEEPAAIGGFVTALRAGPPVDPRYLYNWFSSPNVQSTLRSFGNQTTNISNLNLMRCRALPVPLPPIAEQRRLADIMDRAAMIRAKRQAALAHLDELRQSVFLDMFGTEGRRAVTLRPRDRHHGDWPWTLLTDVAQLATGHTPDRKRPDYWSGEIPWISLPEIRRLDGQTANDTDLRVTALGIANSSAVVLPVGTVCFSRTASIGFVTKIGRPMATSQDFHNWIPGPDLDSDYLMAALRASREHLLGASDGSTHKTIYQRIAEGFEVLLPPLQLQREFANRIHGIDAAKLSGLKQASAADQLVAVLSQQAFAGAS